MMNNFKATVKVAMKNASKEFMRLGYQNTFFTIPS